MKSRGLFLYVACVVVACVAIGVVLWQRRAQREREAAVAAEAQQQVLRVPATGPGLPPGAPGSPGAGPLLKNGPPLPFGRGLSPTPPTIRPGDAGGPPFSGPVRQEAVIDLNLAPESALVTLPGITPEYAKAIVAHRPYRDKPDLEQKTGLPHAVIDRLGPPAMIRSTSIEPLKPPVTKKKGGA